MTTETEKIMFKEIIAIVDKFISGEIDFVEFLEEKIEFYSLKKCVNNPVEDYKIYLKMVGRRGYPDFEYVKRYHEKLNDC